MVFLHLYMVWYNKLMKTLYILVKDCGDGSTSLRYTMNSALIAKLQFAADKRLMDYEDSLIDGDGFHYNTLTVPDECSYASLGISNSYVLDDNYAARVFANDISGMIYP